jgi:hypothetical protein
VEEEGETKAQEDEDIESHWEEEEEDKLYDVIPQASPPPSLTPTPPPSPYEEEQINKWFDEEEDIYVAFPMPPLQPFPLIPIPCPLQPTPPIEWLPSPQIYSHFRTPMTDKEVDTELHNDPFWDNMIKAENNHHHTIKDMKRRAITVGFRLQPPTHPGEEAAPGQDNIATPKQVQCHWGTITVHKLDL